VAVQTQSAGAGALVFKAVVVFICGITLSKSTVRRQALLLGEQLQQQWPQDEAALWQHPDKEVAVRPSTEKKRIRQWVLPMHIQLLALLRGHALPTR
jgi:hypothetical protein